MIIKLIPIKTPGRLARVIEYIAKDKGRITEYRNQGIFHNFRAMDLRKVRKELEANYHEYARKRSNGNIAMHGIISISPLDREHMSLEKLNDITTTFLNKAYPHALAFGAHHNEEAHWHSHVVVSANQLMSPTSTRLSRHDLFEVQKYLIEYAHAKYPELRTHIDLSHWGQKLTDEKTYYMKKRNPDFKLTKEELRDKIQYIFSACESSKQFYDRLRDHGFATYTYKDHIQGIYFGQDDKKMRFSRLGIEPEQFIELDKQNERLQELEKLNLKSYAKEAIREDDDRLRAIEEMRNLDPHAFDIPRMLDHYSYEELRDSQGSPTAIDPDFDKKAEAKEEQTQDEEFATILGYPVQEDEKELPDETDIDDDDDFEKDRDDEPEKEMANDIDDLDKDADDEVDMDDEL